MPSYAIRSTREDDWPLVRALRIENATDNAISYGATPDATRAMTEDDWRMRARRGTAPDATSLVATSRGTGRWIGMMSAQTGDADGPEPVLTGVYVTPEFRGRTHGVADALLDGVLAWTSGRASVLRLYVYEHAEPARRFYDRRGFRPTGRTRDLHVLGADVRPEDGRTIEMALPLG
jgi:GNAT superfamily N-acetyltransferase